MNSSVSWRHACARKGPFACPALGYVLIRRFGVFSRVFATNNNKTTTLSRPLCNKQQITLSKFQSKKSSAKRNVSNGTGHVLGHVSKLRHVQRHLPLLNHRQVSTSTRPSVSNVSPRAHGRKKRPDAVVRPPAVSGRSEVHGNASVAVTNRLNHAGHKCRTGKRRGRLTISAASSSSSNSSNNNKIHSP